MSIHFLTCQLTCGFVLNKSQFVSISRLGVSIDMHFSMCEFLHVKIGKTRKICFKYMHLWGYCAEGGQNEKLSCRPGVDSSYIPCKLPKIEHARRHFAETLIPNSQATYPRLWTRTDRQQHLFPHRHFDPTIALRKLSTVSTQQRGRLPAAKASLDKRRHPAENSTPKRRSTP